MKKEQNALAQARNSKGLTQKELAEQCGITEKTVYLWETNGTKHARISTLMRVAEKLGVGIQEIIC